MIKDLVDFVHQGASIALSMILIQQSEVSSLSLTYICALGQGFINTSGLNVTISLQSQVAGILMQLWVWFCSASSGTGNCWHCICLESHRVNPPP
jgi:26S proteasome regulatory subunit N2